MSAADLRPLARAVVIAFAAAIAVGILLLILFDPDVQTIGADELVRRSDDARAFLVADYLFIAVYAVISPLMIRRFERARGAGAVPWWVMLGVVLLAAAGAVDAAENALLLAGTDGSEGAVDVAHALAVPKVLLFVGGAIVSVIVTVRAVKALRGG